MALITGDMDANPFLNPAVAIVGPVVPHLIQSVPLVTILHILIHLGFDSGESVTNRNKWPFCKLYRIAIR